VADAVPWDNSLNAGFSWARPWLPIDPNYEERYVTRLQNDERSILSLYQRLIKLRSECRSLRVGAARVKRTHESERIVAALNWTEQLSLQIPGLLVSDTLLSTFMDRKG